MDSYIEAKLPFRLLKQCDSENDYDPEIDDEYYKYHHTPTCKCGGSGMMPTTLGYAVLVFLKRAFQHHAWYLSHVLADPTTMQTVINSTSKETIENDRRRRRERLEKISAKHR